MDNAKLITYLLLLMATMSVAHHKRTSSHLTASTPVFLATEGHSRLVTMRTTRKKAVAKALAYTVTATAYQAVAGQTDDEPFITADNSRIKPHYSSRTHWLALSHDLLARWDGDFQYGDQVEVSGISPELDGVYTVHDTMNKRHHHCMDILTHTREKIDICTKNVKIRLAAPTSSRDSSLFVSPARATSLARLQSGAAANSPDLFLATNEAKRADYFASALL
jgi:3D (Asp-Asp-Asp) domain-containing protein